MATSIGYAMNTDTTAAGPTPGPIPAATTSYGHVGAYIQSTSWDIYQEQLECYFLANAIEGEDRKKAIFLSVCGAETYTVLRSLATPKKPMELTFTAAMTLLCQYYNPHPSKYVQRYRFNRRDQLPTKTLSAYIAELRRLSEFCQFHDLEEMLLDRLICGMLDQTLQRRLLADPDLTFSKVYAAALAQETASKDVSMLHGSGVDRPQQAVHKLEGPTKNSSTNIYEQGKMKNIAFIKDPDGYWIEILNATNMAEM